jgi:hypothetical protein
MVFALKSITSATQSVNFILKLLTMKKVFFSLLTLTAFLSTASLQAQTADEIVAKYVDAIGGKDKISKMVSVYIESSLQVMGNEAPSVTTVLNGKGYKSETDFNGQQIIQCYNEKGGWNINPMAGNTAAEVMPDEQYKLGKDQMEIGGALFDYAAKGSKIELLGKDGGTFKIKLVSKDNAETTYLIDGTSYYVTKVTKKGNMMGQDVEVTVNLSDYKKTDFGYVIPYTIQTNFGEQFSFTATVKKVEINKTIDPAIFVIPK